MLEAAVAYVTGLFASGEEPDATRPELRFRTRLSHTRRVLMWTQRLLVQGGVSDTDALLLAAAFHDTGYLGGGAEGHAARSRAHVEAYAKEAGLPPDTAARAAWLAQEHSDKAHWLKRPDAPRDLVLLMEADLLDEEGAMGIALDCLSAGAGGGGYEEAWQMMQRYEPPRLRRQQMVTPLAKRLWRDKQRLIADFLAAYAYDLGEKEMEAPDEA